MVCGSSHFILLRVRELFCYGWGFDIGVGWVKKISPTCCWKRARCYVRGGGKLVSETLQSYQWIGRRVSSPYAGVHRPILKQKRPAISVFPVRGGSPGRPRLDDPESRCLPRTRGFTTYAVGWKYAGEVSSPYAGVHPRLRLRRRKTMRVFPVRGGSEEETDDAIRPYPPNNRGSDASYS